MAKTKLDKAAIVLQLRNQLNKIKEFCKIFDAGSQQICEDIAVKLRIIFHNGGRNKSLLDQLKLTDIPFLDTAKKYDPLKPNYLNAHAGLGKYTIVGATASMEVRPYIERLRGKNCNL